MGATERDGMPMTALNKLRPGTLWEAPSGPGWGPLPKMLLTLTFVTGLVDAASILALGRVFVANMTGNVVFAGFAIVGAPGFSLGASLSALAGFLIGAYAGGFMTARGPQPRVGGDPGGRLLPGRAGAGTVGPDPGACSPTSSSTTVCCSSSPSRAWRSS
jgi:Protein of unknown function (DUF1275)